MSISFPRSLVEHFLLGPAGDRRQLQDSPILGDVWIAYAANPAAPQELLLTPYKDHGSSVVAITVDRQLARDRKPREPKHKTDVAFLQGIVAATLTFDELLRVVVPMTSWWAKEWDNVESSMPDYQQYRVLSKFILGAGHMLAAGNPATRKELRTETTFSALDRFVILAAIILWGMSANVSDSDELDERALGRLITESAGRIADGMVALLRTASELQLSMPDRRSLPFIYQISLNRDVSMALTRSVPAVKADAARNLFKVDCSKIAWAVIDTGVQGNHASFIDPKTKASRVRASFDFSNYRKIVSLDNQRIFGRHGNPSEQAKRLNELTARDDLLNKPTPTQAKRLLRRLAGDLENKRPVHWEFVRPFVEIDVGTPPISDHGTHVAGIIGARAPSDHIAAGGSDGMCPDISIYDFRVVSDDLRSTEFGVIAALQFIRYLNERSDYISIHGANLSLSIPHDVRNYACGRTPVCIECERLVESGVVVVAAAGNRGYQSFTTKEGAYDSYAAFSVTDPGNAEGVITVGSTHRSSPHTYGVSFFSSRGPTGDGRPKPDLVAPGERIRAPFRYGWGDLDGTSMAAPHVSGAAAMLLARYTELIGRPRRIKQILCESATDLGRERSFQGNGMLDVLRAFQKL